MEVLSSVVLIFGYIKYEVTEKQISGRYLPTIKQNKKYKR